MNEIYFENVGKIGNLYLEKVLNEFEGENIIFTCTDDEEKYYFCVCYEFRYKLEWIICQVKIKDLVSVLYKFSDLCSLFKNSDAIIQIIEEDETDSIYLTSYDKINKKYLPTPGVYFKPDYDISNYCLSILSKLKSAYEITLSMENIPYNSEFFDQDLTIYCDKIYNYGIEEDMYEEENASIELWRVA